MKARNILIGLLILPLLAVECYDEPFEPELPPPTREGSNMVACKINGVVWKKRGEMGLDENPSTGYSPNEESFGFVAARFYRGSASRFYVSLSNVIDTGRYYVWGRFGQVPGHHLTFHGQKRCSAVRENPGMVYISYINDEDHIIAGKFQFQGICDDGDTIEVTDGWFDLKY
jgi:hypothetical protein